MPLTPEQILRFLKSVHPYDTLPAPAQEALAPRFEVREVARDATVYALGETLPGLFIVYEGAVEITDFCPRFEARGRSFRPQMIIRRIRPLEGWPRVRIRLRPRFDWGRSAPEITQCIVPVAPSSATRIVSVLWLE